MPISSRLSASLSRRKILDWNQHADFFRFTRGRFVADEENQMAQRHIKFDMNKLCKIASDATGKDCIHVEKFADGMYNKAFLLTMEDDGQVVAKVPNPNAGLPHFTTASEVATMDLMRNIMQTPTPQVLAWDSSSENAVKAEYIIMEKAKGVQLGTVWPRMNLDQKAQLMRSIARHQRTWSKICFGGIGSLYYKRDLPMSPIESPVFFGDSGNPVADSKFAIGPIVAREWMDFGRADLDCERGPWTSIEDYRRAVLKRDLAAARNPGTLPTPLTMLCGPSLYQPTQDKKRFACKAALKALPHVLPKEPWASTPHIWHDDLHEENIFVDANDPTTIVAIIDWQSTCIAPLFDHTVIPGFLDYDGPTIQGLERPKMPPLSQILYPKEKAGALKLYEEQVLVSGYKALLHKNIKSLFDAVAYEESEASGFINTTRNMYEVGEAYCLGSLAEMENSPVHFSEAELASIHEDVEKTAASMNAMNVIKDALGPLFPEKGCVRPDLYDDSKAALRRVKCQVIEDFSTSAEDRKVWEEVWPFGD